VSNPALDPNGYGNGMTANVIPWILSAVVGLFAWFRTRTRDDASGEATARADRDRLTRLEQGHRDLVEKWDDTNRQLARIAGQLDVLIRERFPRN
jgi:hypothetical protein